MGYHRAGFDVVGVDINPHPNYPFPFVQADALAMLDGSSIAGHFDAIHASPPCKAHNNLRFLHRDVEHRSLIEPTRDRLDATGLPYVIENVVGAPIRKDVVLCGSMFGLGVWRHRWFELSWPVLPLVAPCRHDFRPMAVYGHTGVTTRSRPGRTRERNGSKAEWEQAMDIDWMTADELAQAIPPAYTEWIGERLLAAVEEVAA